jgi:iron complex transport system substrate-binding protein
VRLSIDDLRLTIASVPRLTGATDAVSARACRSPVSRASAHVLTIAACLFALCLSACDRTPPPSPTTVPSRDAPRIVSLSPAISHTLIDLELDDDIVGRTQYCTSLDQSIPVVGDLQNINFEALVRLNPTHILVQPPAGGVDAHLQRIADEHGWKIAAWHLNTIDDIRTMLREMPAALFDEASPQRTELDQHAASLSKRIDLALTVSPEMTATVPALRGRVLMVNAVNPVMAFGAGTYLDDLLSALGRGEAVNAVAERGWVQLSLEDVVRLQPDAIVLVKPNANADDLQRDLGPLATIDVPAVKDGRLALLSHPDAFMPSTGVIGVADDLRAILQQLGKIRATIGSE